MREFNLEEAKAGKPVCTRDGRKARIVCFDRKCNYPIIALVECPWEDGIEVIITYNLKGEHDCSSVDFLMMEE